jgi:aryl-alcohol dehydrogenase-like predicted oxidoreductase
MRFGSRVDGALGKNFLTFLQHWSVRSRVRPVDAARIAAGPADERADNLERAIHHYMQAVAALFPTRSWVGSLVGRGLEYEFQSFAEYHNIGILVWSPLAGGFLSGKYSRTNPAPTGTRFAEAGSFVPFDKEIGYRVVEMLAPPYLA